MFYFELAEQDFIRNIKIPAHEMRYEPYIKPPAFCLTIGRWLDLRRTERVRDAAVASSSTHRITRKCDATAGPRQVLTAERIESRPL